MNAKKFSTGIIFDVNDDITFTQKEIIQAGGGPASEVPQSEYINASFFKDAAGREVQLLKFDHDKWENSIFTEDDKYVVFTEFADEKDRANFTHYLDGSHESCFAKLIFGRNINGKKNYRFLGVFYCDNNASGKKGGWYNVRFSTCAAAAPIVVCKLGSNVTKFNKTL